MHKILMTFVSLLAFVSAEVSAQLSVSYMMDTPSFTLAHEDTDKSQTLDTCYLTVTYRLKYKSSEKDDSLSYDDLMGTFSSDGATTRFSAAISATSTSRTQKSSSRR